MGDGDWRITDATKCGWDDLLNGCHAWAIEEERGDTIVLIALLPFESHVGRETMRQHAEALVRARPDGVRRHITTVLDAVVVEGLPVHSCPGCSAPIVDYDGFGPVAHLDPVPESGLPPDPTACGWCSHPACSGGTCDLCGREEPHGEASGR